MPFKPKIFILWLFYRKKLAAPLQITYFLVHQLSLHLCSTVKMVHECFTLITVLYHRDPYTCGKSVFYSFLSLILLSHFPFMCLNIDPVVLIDWLCKHSECLINWSPYKSVSVVHFLCAFLNCTLLIILEKNTYRHSLRLPQKRFSKENLLLFCVVLKPNSLQFPGLPKLQTHVSAGSGWLCFR